MPTPSRQTPHSAARLRAALGRLFWLSTALGVAISAGLAAADPALPQRNLLVELREADAGQAPAGASGWSARSADASIARERPSQQLRVLNGGSASMRVGVTRPLQVWQVAPGAWLPTPVPTTQWIEAGQRLTVQPRWPGGREPVSVAIAFESSQLDTTVARGSAELPQRTEASVTTTLRAPLGQWVTVAATGTEDGNRNAISSGEAAALAQRVLQLRVSLAP